MKSAVGVGLLALAVWLFVVGSFNLANANFDEREAFQFGVAIFVATWLGALLVGARRAAESDRN